MPNNLATVDRSEFESMMADRQQKSQETILTENKSDKIYGLSNKVAEVYSPVDDYTTIVGHENDGKISDIDKGRRIPIHTGEDAVTVAQLASAVKSVNFIPQRTSNELKFDLPNWGVENYINERNRWVKGITSIADQPGWFYFKVFFKFDTNFGLFGGILNDTTNQELLQSTCALRYLNNIKTLYRVEQIPMRINSLLKFTSILSQINSKYPWMINGVTELAEAMKPVFKDDNIPNENRSIGIKFNTETTDMRVINMLNYYKHACFDDINNKEIIPENLRKFDMMVVFYHVPIRYFQTAIMTAPKTNLKTGLFKPGSKLAKAENIINKAYNFLTSKSTYYKYKRMHTDNNDYSNMMSFYMMTFQNCEFDVDSFSNYFNSEYSNETAFQFEKPTIRINYEKVYYHVMNEWSQTLFGSDGFYYDVNFAPGSGWDKSKVEEIKNGLKGNSSDNFEARKNAIKVAKEGPNFFDKDAAQYAPIVDYAESIIMDGLMNMSMRNYYAFLKGNLYGGNIGVGSDYFTEKNKYGTVRGNIYGNTGVGSRTFRYKLDQLRDMSKNGNGTVSGNIFGETIIRDKNSAWKDSYFTRKIKAIKEGTLSYTEDGGYSIKPVKSQLENERTGLHPIFNFENNRAGTNPYSEDATPIIDFNESKKQKTNIFNYLVGNLGYSKLTGQDDGLFSGVKNTINDTMSFWKISKNDW